jgi:hypothetical protein
MDSTQSSGRAGRGRGRGRPSKGNRVTLTTRVDPGLVSQFVSEAAQREVSQSDLIAEIFAARYQGHDSEEGLMQKSA